ncbi:MAG: hypothetical protein VX335_04135 [Pseudomonadota bacterium]|nr:hypothetical protein [Pseudomonadota bacterium]
MRNNKTKILDNGFVSKPMQFNCPSSEANSDTYKDGWVILELRKNLDIIRKVGVCSENFRNIKKNNPPLGTNFFCRWYDESDKLIFNSDQVLKKTTCSKEVKRAELAAKNTSYLFSDPNLLENVLLPSAISLLYNSDSVGNLGLSDKYDNSYAIDVSIFLSLLDSSIFDGGIKSIGRSSFMVDATHACNTFAFPDTIATLCDYLLFEYTSKSPDKYLLSNTNLNDIILIVEYLLRLKISFLPSLKNLDLIKSDLEPSFISLSTDPANYKAEFYAIRNHIYLYLEAYQSLEVILKLYNLNNYRINSELDISAKTSSYNKKENLSMPPYNYISTVYYKGVSKKLSQKVLDEYFERIDLNELLQEIKKQRISGMSKPEIIPESTQAEVSQQKKDNISIINKLSYYVLPWIIFSCLIATLIYTSPSLNPIFTNFLNYMSAKVYYYLGINMMSFSSAILISVALPIVVLVISVFSLYPRLIKHYAHTSKAETSNEKQVKISENNYKPLVSKQLTSCRSSLNDLCDSDKNLENQSGIKNIFNKGI